MSELKVIENELVPVYETSTGEKVVYGTELYECLESKQEYSNWVKNRLKDCDAAEDKDFTIILSKSTGGRPKQEYIIKLNTAKEMAMMERNEKGKQVRRYFIRIEEKYKEDQSRKKLSATEELKLHGQAILEVDEKISAVNKDLQNFKQDMPILGIEESRITAAVKRKGVYCLGGKETPAYNDRSIRGKVFSDIYGQIKRELGLPYSCTYKAIKRSQCELVIGIVEAYELPACLKMVIEVYNGDDLLY